MKETYEERRHRWYEGMRREGIFTWDRMYGQEYALASIHYIPESFRREIACATERLGRIFAKILRVIRHGDDALLRELGLPEETFGAVRVAAADEILTLIGRFDFARTPSGLKMLEFNSDTPTGIVEAFYVNGRICADAGVKDPNAGMEWHLTDAFQKLLTRYRERGYCTDRIVFSALDWHEEDAGTTRYLLQQSKMAARFVPLDRLRVQGDALVVPEGGEELPVNVWYRLHALEILAKEQDTDGYPTGAHILDLVARKKLAIINPPGAFLAQTKALQALIWNLHEEGQFFTPEEHEWIEALMLPTYLENRFAGRSPYVTKPVFGREGGAVTLYDAEGEPEERDVEKLYWDQPMVFQQRVELEPVETETLKGPFQGRLLWGSFLIGGRASAILARVDGPITGNLSYFLPVAVKDDGT